MYFHPVLTIIYRFTDPLVSRTRNLIRSESKSVVGLIIIFLMIRGVLLAEASMAGIGSSVVLSTKGLLDTLYQVYLVIVILVAFGVYQHGIIESVAMQILKPIYYVQDMVITRKRSRPLTLFLTLVFLYNLLNIVLLSIATLTIQGNILSSFHSSLLLIVRLVSFFTLVIIAGALLSWVSPDPYNPIVQAIYSISDPILMPFRRIIPPLGGIDFSPIFAIIALQVVGRLGTEMINTLFGYLSRTFSLMM